MRRRAKIPKLKQPTPAEMLDSCLSVVEAKFYPGHRVAFEKDKPRLLAWVIFYPAKWLNERGVTIPATRYLEVFRAIMIDAAAHGDLGSITYLPAWLAKVIQSHFAMHGEELYDEAKAMRNLVENAIVVAGRHIQPETDVVQAMVDANRVLNVAKGRRKVIKPVRNDQLTFL